MLSKILDKPRSRSTSVILNLEIAHRLKSPPGANDTTQRSENVTIAATKMSENLSSVASAMEESSTNVNMVATIDIKSLIDDVQNTSKLTEGGITEISTVITNVSKIVSTIASAVEEQTAATQEIANNINQASHGIQNANESVNLGSVVATDISKDISEVQEQHIVFLKAVMMWSKVPLIYWVVFKSLTPGS